MFLLHLLEHLQGFVRVLCTVNKEICYLRSTSIQTYSRPGRKFRTGNTVSPLIKISGLLSCTQKDILKDRVYPLNGNKFSITFP